jgi:hypothetical protein
MYKITNIENLGHDYTVTDSNGNVLKVIQVIPQTEILDAALGEYTAEFGTYSNYLKKSIAVMTGFEDVNPTRVLWYATLEEEVVLSEIIEFALHNGYDKIILEHLEVLE